MSRRPDPDGAYWIGAGLLLALVAVVVIGVLIGDIR